MRKSLGETSTLAAEKLTGHVPLRCLSAAGRLRRRGAISRRLVVLLAFVGVALAAGWQFLAGDSFSAPTAAPLTAEVVVGRFVHEVVERGEIQSSSNVEVRCEVRSRSNFGTAILEIVPEGTYVQPGDFLVRLDDSALQTEVVQQQIDVNNSQASVIQATTALETAKLAKREYESGTFLQEREELQSKVFVAEEDLRRAEEYLRYSERLAAKGYVTPVQLEADRFAVEKARKELDVARTKLDVLNNFTRQKVLRQLDADIQTAEARLRAAEDSHQIEINKLELLKEQIARCMIQAPSAGQVVYANENSSRSGEVLIEEGRLVRERQVLIRLPDPRKMQVAAKINEARIDLVDPGLSVTVRVDALPGAVLSGKVRRVGEYPLPSSYYSSHVKEYLTEIDIHDPIEGMRPGMTAEVAIRVEQRNNVKQVPVQAVVERNGRHYCLLQGGGNQFEAREVQVGSTNNRFIVIEDGLEAGEQVVITPKQYLDTVSLPAASASGGQVASGAHDDEPVVEQARLQRQRRRVHVVNKVALGTADDNTAADRGTVSGAGL